ncbi:MAG: preprotein translocase subunit SecE [Candidatus Paceibacterota bacterium]
MNKIKKFFQESSQEFKRVNWPTRSETIKFTLVVVFMSLALAGYLGLLDYVFVTILETLVI